VIEVKFGVDAFRTLRTSLMQIAYCIATDASLRGCVVLAESPITQDRLQDEWERALTIFRPEVLNRLTICRLTKGLATWIPHEPETRTVRAIYEAAGVERGKLNATRIDYSFVITKLLLHQWLTSGKPVTSEWLSRTAGCSYPAVARALKSLGSLLERGSDRRVVLRWFPRDDFVRLVALSPRARFTTRFADHSGKPRTPESYLRRLEKLNPPGLGIGGVLGARHYCAELDIVGTPQLDISLHSPGKHLDLRFVEQLDPALKRVLDPLAPANLVVHSVSQADPLFTPREGGLAWADPLECLFDLHEARLGAQASQFLTHLEVHGKEGLAL
jgi:hypothetical protein